MERLPLQRRMKRLPLALSGAEVGQLLAMIRKDSYCVMVMAMDSTGLRSREAVRLRHGTACCTTTHRAVSSRADFCGVVRGATASDLL